MKQINSVCLITRDVQRLANFYGAALECKIEGDDRFAYISTQGPGLSFFAEPGMDQMAPGSMQGAGRGSFTLEVQVEDVDREYARMVELGAAVVKPPTTQPWGWRSAWFRDPDGNILNFCAPVELQSPPAGSLDSGEKD